MTNAFWRGRRVLVTGHTGFKGAWLTLWLERLGADVTGYSIDVPTVPSLYEAARVSAGIESITGDVRELSMLSAAVGRVRPETIFHLAAQSLVRRSLDEPVDTFTTNVLGTVNVLEVARACGDLQSVVVATSDKCYVVGEAAHTEDDPLGGDDPYSASKASAELVTAAYRRSFFSRAGAAAVASVRAGNVIGGGDWAIDRLVPDFMRAALEGEAVVVRNPSHVRPWQHVLDPLAGYLALAERMSEDRAMAAAWNFGPAEADARSVRTLVDGLVARWSTPVSVTIADHNARSDEATTLRLDSSRARRLLGWRSLWSFDQALDATVEWFLAFAAGEDLRAASLSQIARYERVLRA